MHPVIEIVFSILAFVLLFKVLPYVALFNEICKIVYEFFTIILMFICAPFTQIYLAIKSKITIPNPRKDNFLTSFTDRHPTLGRPKAILFVLVSILFVVGTFLLHSPQDIDEFHMEVLQAFPITYAMFIMLGEVELTFFGVITSGISIIILGLLFRLFMDDYKIHLFDFSFLVSLIYYIVTVAVSCTLSYLLSGVWEWLANTGFRLFDILKFNIFNPHATFISWAIAIASSIPLIIILYIGLIIVIAAVRDYLDMILYGILGIIISLIIKAFLAVTTIDKYIPNNFLGIIFLLCIFGVDYYRVNKDAFTRNRRPKKNETNA